MKIESENKNEYVTKDFYLGVCLLAAGIIPKLQKVSDRTFFFIFPNENSQVEKLIEKHWKRELSLPTKDIIEAINQLKTRIYEGR